MKRVPLTIALAGALALGACGPEQASEPDPVREAIAPSEPSGEVRAVESYTGFSGAVVDLALIVDDVSPWRSRGLALLDSGQIALIDVAQGAYVEAQAAAGTTVISNAAFSLRGEATPLVAVSGGQDQPVRAFLYLADDEELVEVPVRASAAGGGIVGACLIARTQAALDLALVSQTDQSAWRLRDDGGDDLALTPLEGVAAPLDNACPERLRTQASRGARARLAESGGATDAAILDDTAVQSSLDAFPALGSLRVRPTPGAPAALIEITAGLNSQSVAEPAILAASTQNFGGSFPQGVVLVSDGSAISVLAFDDVISEARKLTRAPS